MSKFASKNWADAESDSDEERDNAAGPTQAINEENLVENAESDESSEDEESKLDGALIESQANRRELRAVSRKNISKKEQKIKEMHDLESVLKEFGVTGDQEVGADVSEQATENPASDGNEKSKKKRKKKVMGAPAQTALQEENSQESTLSPVDVSAILKSKMSAKKSTKSSSTVDAQKLAIAEAKSAADKKKKKKDLTKFSEFSY
mmetsp:Transcript_31617/g.23442  ORF Transcript_31617/g.23442 Transcript_31617/m.23442 type:complete len:206 (-) Transcript_31617:112-729(-)